MEEVTGSNPVTDTNHQDETLKCEKLLKIQKLILFKLKYGGKSLGELNYEVKAALSHMLELSEAIFKGIQLNHLSLEAKQRVDLLS